MCVCLHSFGQLIKKGTEVALDKKDHVSPTSEEQSPGVSEKPLSCLGAPSLSDGGEAG